MSYESELWRKNKETKIVVSSYIQKNQKTAVSVDNFLGTVSNNY
jgi:hypothetical protein